MISLKWQVNEFGLDSKINKLNYETHLLELMINDTDRGKLDTRQTLNVKS